MIDIKRYYLQIQNKIQMQSEVTKDGLQIYTRTTQKDYRWRSGQSARLSPLRLRVRFSARTFSMKVVGFLRALRFPPTGKLTGWVRISTDKEVKSQLL